ncbi:MAG: hypothetical protein H6925_00330 [Holosporaceae bacterium]|nr:MAG: hypothetical protein H6925_00330 [Holosporaceae bacterium]
MLTAGEVKAHYNRLKGEGKTDEAFDYRIAVEDMFIVSQGASFQEACTYMKQVFVFSLTEDRYDYLAGTKRLQVATEICFANAHAHATDDPKVKNEWYFALFSGQVPNTSQIQDGKNGCIC